MTIEDCVFDIGTTKFYLPYYETDCISRCISGVKDYWDKNALILINKYLKDNANIIDIGANVGSHTLYWCLERNANKVYSFEPLPDTFLILKKNIELNNLTDRVVAFNIGLSDESCSTTINNFSLLNIGGTSFEKVNNGEFEFQTLDSLEIPEQIDLIKIDVEGAEVEVLNGAKNTILKSKPVIVLETFTHKEEVDEFMQSISYTIVDTIREGEDYIYAYNE